MADNVTVDNGGLTDYVTATDDDGVAQVQWVKLKFGADGVFTAVDATNPLPATAVGTIAEDAAISGNPVRVGVRGSSAVPTAMSADNDFVTPWADRSGALAVIPQPRVARITATPTIATSGYVAGGLVGTLMTFTGAALATGRAGQILQAVLTTRTPTAINALELWLFATSPTIASADSAAFDLTDANLEAAIPLGVITFTGSDYCASSSNAVCTGLPETLGAPLPSYVTTATANIFGVLVARTVAAQYAGASDIVVALTVNQF